MADKPHVPDHHTPPVSSSVPSQADPPVKVGSDLPPIRRPARPDNIEENPVGQANPPVDQR